MSYAAFDSKIRNLTGVTPRKRDKILRMMHQLQEELLDNDLVLFCGGCRDDALLVHKDTGIHLGSALGCGVWMGGDWSERQTSQGIRYNPDVSSTAGDFAR